MMEKYNFFAIQKQITELWAQHNVFQLCYDKKKEDFVIDTPPPTVSGSLHIGHVFSYIHQDIVARYKRMDNFNVVFPFGFDNNGLPTERYIEKLYGISAKKMDSTSFINFCYQGIGAVQESFISLWKSLGLSYDWTLIYSTISQDTIKISQKLFIDLFKKGYVYKKQEPALFCTVFQTSISQADLEEVEKETVMSTVLFHEKETGDSIAIATTRPELLAGCVAVLVNPHDERYQHLVGKKAIVPLYKHIVPIIADDSVIIDKGTGVVMSATFGDGLDVYWFKKYNFPYVKIINKNGTLSSVTLFLEGLKIGEGRTKIIALLEDQGYLTKKEKLVHRVSIYERSKNEIEYIMLDQWFISILPYKQELLEIADRITWYPSYMKVRYIEWVKNISWDWCISRQRVFGVPFPVWYDEKGNIILASNDELPVDPRNCQPLCAKSDNQYYQADMDVMDTWNTSSITPYLIHDLVERVYGVSLSFPFAVRPQSHDIIRTWAFDTIVKLFFLDNTIPWKNIVISGHVITDAKEKISKSKGNSPLDPVSLITQYPADVIRYWSASAKLGIDTVFSVLQLKDGNKLLVKLWNAAIFLSQYTDFSSTHELIFVNVGCNSFILNKIKCIESEYHSCFDVFNFSGALESVEKFFWFFCDYYIEIMKLYPTDFIYFKEIQETASFIFYKILLMLCPFLPFICEYLYQYYFKPNTFLSVMHWGEKKIAASVGTHDFDILINCIDAIRKARTEKKLSFKVVIDECRVYVLCQKVFNYLQKEDSLYILKNIAKAEVVSVMLMSEHKQEFEQLFFWEDNILTICI